MTHSLPPHPSLENLKKQAKTLLSAWQAGDLAALSRVRAAHPRHANASEDELSAAQPRLADCQLVLAREAGFDTWAALKAAVEESHLELANRFLNLACLCYYGPYTFDRAKADELLRENPQLATANIWAAAAAGDAATVGGLLDQDPDLVNRTGGPRGWTPLLYLCASRASGRDDAAGALETARVLLARGADANAHYWDGGTYKFTALTSVIGEGEGGVRMYPPHQRAFELARLLLDAGANPNDSQGLYDSMFTGGTRWLELLFEYGLTSQDTVNWVTDNKLPTVDYLLAQACKYNQVDRAALLLQHGADANARDYYSPRRCYELAIKHGNTNIAELLLSHGAAKTEPMSDQERFYAACMAVDMEAVENLRRERPDEVASWIAAGISQLGEAASANKLQAARLLLKLGFPVGQALHEAAWKGHLEMAHLLVEHGASVRNRDRDHGATPVGWADHAGHLKVRDFLLTGPIEIFDAIRFDRPDRIDEILTQDAGALERPLGEYLSRPHENAGHTPLAEAVATGKTDVVRMLLAHGADVMAKHHDGRSLEQVAVDNGYDDVVEMLRNHSIVDS